MRSSLGGGVGLLVLLLAANPSAAQRTIHVVDANGQPVPSAQVEVWGTAELIEVVSSNFDGAAEITTDRWDDVTRLTLRHLNYRTLIVQAADVPTNGIIPLEPDAIAIDGLAVVGRGDLCPIADEPAARTLWAEVAARYATNTGSQRVTGELMKDGGYVSRPNLFRVEEAEMRRGDYGWSPTIWPRSARGVRESTLDELIAATGYGWEPRGGRERNHGYPKLDTQHAYHFASPVFGDLHDFSLFSERSGEATLVFCPSEKREGVWIQGLITLMPEDAFVRAQWRFMGADPDEEAGGEVEFLIYERGPRRRPLFSKQGIFYRHTGNEPLYPELPRGYYREVHIHTSWNITARRRGPGSDGR